MKNMLGPKAPLKCWVPQKFDGKVLLKLYHNVKEDDIFDTFLQGFSKQMCLKSNIDERIQNLGFSVYNRKP